MTTPAPSGRPVESDDPCADTSRAGLSRRRLLQAGATVGGAAAVTAATGSLAAAAASASPEAPALARTAQASGTATTTLTVTAATNGAATLAATPDGPLVAEVQNVLWSVPRDGGRATALTPPGLEPTRPVLSPDGQHLAVCAYRGGGFHLWTLAPDGTDLVQRTDGPWDDRAPAWSPDGRRLAFASERSGDPVGGSPYRIWVLTLDTAELAPLTGLDGQDGPHQSGPWEDFDPVWSADGQRVLFVRGAVVQGPTGPALKSRTLASVAADGTGPVRTEYQESAEAEVMTPAVSPDGRIAHLRTTPQPAGTCTLVVAGKAVAVGGDVAPVPPRWVGRDELLLTVDGQFTLVRADDPGAARRIPFRAELPVTRPRYQVKEYDLDGHDARPVRGVHLPALSPDGRRVAFAALNSLWIADVDGKRRPRALVRARPSRYLLAPAWTPDGTALLYADDRDGLLAIRRHDLDSGKDTELASGGRVFPALSPDGRRLACLDLAGNLLVRDLATGEERTLAAPLGGGGVPGPPSWSADGKHLALCDRNRLNMRFREGYNLIRVVDAATGAARLHAPAPHLSLADRYASGPVWSPDGRTMAFVSESALWLLPVRADGTPDGKPRMLADEPADHPSWSGDSRTLLYQSAGRLRRVDAKGGAPRTVPVHLTCRRPRTQDTVVHAGRLWDGTGERVREDVDVVVRDGRIAEVTPHRAGRPAARRVDASGLTVLPGLWDAHTHPWQTTYGGRQTATQLAYGITTAVSLGGFSYEQARLREAITAGALAGPRLLSTGELLDGARVAYSMGRAHRTEEGLRRSLARGAALDWDFVKTYVRAPGWVMKAAADFAHERLGVRSGSHLCTPGSQLGQDLTTHLQATQRLEFGHAITASGHAQQDVEEIYTGGNGFHLVATPFGALALLGADPALARDPRVTRLLPPWDVQSVEQRAKTPPTRDELAWLDRETAIYRRILAGGGLIVLGTDAPLVPLGLHLHLALRALHRAGLTPAQTLRTATALPARVFGADRDLGTVEEGKLADLTLVDGDPFTDFDALIRTVSVVRGGQVFQQDDLVGEFPAPRKEAAATGGADARHWEAVGRQLRRDSCCDGAVD
ncbi:amidohydrolase family protein [Streptomyces sp. NPDC059009]|uniref:amidohydrolase family protein n=1 Tax=Streptomyces sp. NPDC059009 TaxID=3346694 RepID=UPI00368C0E9F